MAPCFSILHKSQPKARLAGARAPVSMRTLAFSVALDGSFCPPSANPVQGIPRRNTDRGLLCE